MPLFRCVFCTPKADTLCSVSIRQKRSSSRLPAEFGAENFKDRFTRNRNPCCINSVKYKACCVFRYILFHLRDGWALYLFRLQGSKHRPVFSSTFLASYYCTIATGFNVQAFLRDVTLIFCHSFIIVSIYVCNQFSCNLPIKFTNRHPESC
jgi:hypothetical protein